MQKAKSIGFYIIKFLCYALLFVVAALLFNNFFQSFYKGNYVAANIEGSNVEGAPLELYYMSEGDREYTVNKYSSANATLKDGELSFNDRIEVSDSKIQSLRVDLGDKSGGTFLIKGLVYVSDFGKGDALALAKNISCNNMTFEKTEEGLRVTATGDDPYIMFDGIEVVPYKNNYTAVFAVLAALVSVLFINRFVRLKAIYQTAIDLYTSRRLLWSLSKNDFRNKFAGSYFGIIWAFVQPVCTILVFWFVFQIGFKSTDVDNVPFIVWLMCGIIPWFFFSEAWGSATGALLEYGFLVKKVVFQVHILPLVKIISAFFVHAFFIVFMIFVFLLYGMKPDICWAQVLYYCLCMVALVISISFITTPLMVFFRDLGQIMNIILQFGMWLTPIMWNINTIGIPARYIKIFKLNPMYYVVQGYRDSFIYGVPFYNNIKQTLYFWAVVLLLMLAGSIIFRRLKPHFADVM